MKLLTMIKKLRQTPYLQLVIIAFLAAASIGGWLFLKRGESNDHLIAASTVSQDKPAGTLELTQKEIEDLLDLKGEAFIEIGRFKRSSDANEYWQYHSKFQEMVNGLEDYNRFILESGFRKEVEGPDGGQRISYEQYYRLLIGPFNEENALKDQERLLKRGYQNVSLQRLTKSEELYPLQQYRLLFLYTRNKGPKFTSGWLYLWFDHIEYAISGNKMLLHSISTHHGYRDGGHLFVIDGTDGVLIDKFETQGFLVLPNGQGVIVQKEFYIPPNDGKTEADFEPGYELDKHEIAKVAKEVGVSPNQLPVEYVGPRTSAVVSVLYKLDLETDQLQSLKVFGGLGGIFMMKDGTIYSSNSNVRASYAGQAKREDPLGLFGKRPYYRFDLKKKALAKMPDEFVPDAHEIVQPISIEPREEFTAIAETGLIKLISFKMTFYLWH